MALSAMARRIVARIGGLNNRKRAACCKREDRGGSCPDEHGTKHGTMDLSTSIFLVLLGTVKISIQLFVGRVGVTVPAFFVTVQLFKTTPLKFGG